MIRQDFSAVTLYSIARLLLVIAVMGLPCAAAAEPSEQEDDPRVVQHLVDAKYEIRRHNGARALVYRQEALAIAEEVYEKDDGRLVTLRTLVQSAERMMRWTPQDWKDNEELDALEKQMRQRSTLISWEEDLKQAERRCELLEHLLGSDHSSTLGAILSRCESLRAAGQLTAAAHDLRQAGEKLERLYRGIPGVEALENSLHANLCKDYGDYTGAARFFEKLAKPNDTSPFDGHSHWLMRVAYADALARSGEITRGTGELNAALASRDFASENRDTQEPLTRSRGYYWSHWSVDSSREWNLNLKEQIADHAAWAGKADSARQQYHNLLKEIEGETHRSCDEWKARLLRRIAKIGIQQQRYADAETLLSKADELDPTRQWVSQHHRIRGLLGQRKLDAAAKLAAETHAAPPSTSITSMWSYLKDRLELLELWSEASADPEITKLVAEFDQDIRRRCDVPNLHQMRVLRCQARLALHNRDHTEALAKANEALAMQEKLLGTHHFALPETLDLLAAIYQSQGSPLASKVATARAKVIRKAYREG